MKKTSRQWWLLNLGLAALVVGLVLRLFVPVQNDAMHFIEGLCLGFSIAVLLGGMMKVRRDASGDSGRV
ncbi:MAG TPA: hypothetical protein VJY33_18060 [Isosphaeraceae bacterium]|nr:hypothetical protein [Isosphaeraceae bacterium]